MQEKTMSAMPHAAKSSPTTKWATGKRLYAAFSALFLAAARSVLLFYAKWRPVRARNMPAFVAQALLGVLSITGECRVTGNPGRARRAACPARAQRPGVGQDRAHGGRHRGARRRVALHAVVGVRNRRARGGM